MSRNAYALFPYGGGVDFEVRNWGDIDAGPQKWGGGMVAHSQKWGGTHLRPKAVRFCTPPLSVFLAPSLNTCNNIGKS